MIGVDDKLWNIIEDCVRFQVNSEGMILGRKSLIDAQKKIYRKHHKLRGILVEVLPHLRVHYNC